MSDFTNDLKYPKSGSLLFDTKDLVDVTVSKTGNTRSMTATYTDPETGEVLQTSEGGGAEMYVTFIWDSENSKYTIETPVADIIEAISNDVTVVGKLSEGNMILYPVGWWSEDRGDNYNAVQFMSYSGVENSGELISSFVLNILYVSENEGETEVTEMFGEFSAAE